MKIKRLFIVGDEWVYYKLYCGIKASDHVLINISNVINQLINKGLIEKWFFIRYNDPDYHIRIRVKLFNKSDFGFVVQEFTKELNYLVSKEMVWRVVLDSYNREIERYGKETIFQSELLFQYSSELAISFISISEKIRWLYGIKIIDEMLNDFRFTLNRKIQLFSWLRKGFGEEFGIDKELKKQISNKYRNHRTEINNLMDLNKCEGDFFNILNKVKKRNLEVSLTFILKEQKNKTLEVNFEDFAASHIHMFMNRFFRSKQRLYELICYDFLFRHYNSKQARKNNL